MDIYLKTRYLDDAAVLQFGHYGDGQIAVTFISEENCEPLTTATVNLAAYGIYPASGTILVANSNQNQGMVNALEENGIIVSQGETFSYGFNNEAVECVLADEWKVEYNKFVEAWSAPAGKYTEEDWKRYAEIEAEVKRIRKEEEKAAKIRPWF